MARSDNKGIWGTGEELLLAFAVHRLGTGDWDSVAMEVRTRATTALPHLLTAQTCQQRYHDLLRRFQGGEDEDEDGREVDGGATNFAITWLDELRRIRIAELRREVQRHDVSIMSLESKVERLKEEKKQSIHRENFADTGSPEPGEERHDGSRTTRTPEETIAGDLTGRSCNESNSPVTKGEEPREPRAENVKEEEDKVGAESADPDLAATGDEKGGGEGSCNGSSDTVAKGGADAATTTDDVGGREDPRPPPESSDSSMAESKGEDAATEESSDVQSSASPSRRGKRGGRRKAATAASGDSPEAEQVTPPSKSGDARSGPLVPILQIVRSSKYGSIFERRLDSQESTRYRSLIRQHMDLEIVRGKLDECAYSTVELFRDLLLLCANATVYYPKGSSEYIAATHLRKLVHKEITNANQKPGPLPPPPQASPVPPSQPPTEVAAVPPPPSQATASKPKAEPELASSQAEKARPMPPHAMYRKRSSLSAKAAFTAVEEEEEVEKNPEVKKEPENVEKKKMTRGIRTTKPRGPAMKKPSVATATNEAPKPKSPEPPKESATKPKSPEPTESAREPTKTADKSSSSSSTNNNNRGSNSDATEKKKKSAAGFLNRLKKTTVSPSTNNRLPPPPVLKRSIAAAGDVGKAGGGSDQKKSSVNGDGRKQMQEQSAPPKRSVGRPPKRPMPTPPSSQQPPSKRAREAEMDASPPPPRAAAAGTVAKKRGRR